MKLCKICGSNHLVQEHHIVGGNGKRKQCETEQSKIFLCWEHHHGTNGVHGKNGRALTLKLRLELQELYFEMGYAEQEVRKMMGGKLYENVS